ncbi:MAG: deoxyribodipyrimidine photo-lyase [Alphaproteobacteria bacterium]|nr:deoxyribodipyrimidine photo-lyase [Alphaproteobacteria bacterium]
MSTNAPIIVWFRQDLRLTDNPALRAVGDRPVVALYIHDEAGAGRWAPGGASRWWLHHSLEALAAALAAAGVELGRDYPRPIIDHGEARKRALAAFSSLRRAA